MIQEDPRRSQVSQDGHIRYQMILDDPTCSQPLPDEPQLNPNGFKLSQMVPQSPKFFKLFFSWLIADVLPQMPPPSCPLLNNKNIVWGFTLGLCSVCACVAVKYISYVVEGRVGMGVTHYIVRWYDLDPSPAQPSPAQPTPPHPAAEQRNNFC